MNTSEKPSRETLKRWQENPDHWIWGVFYYNPADKRIFPPKRIPVMGWTVNFANPVSYLTLLVFLVVVFLVFSYLGKA